MALFGATLTHATDINIKTMTQNGKSAYLLEAGAFAQQKELFALAKMFFRSRSNLPKANWLLESVGGKE